MRAAVPWNCTHCDAPQAAGRASLGAQRRVVLKIQTFEWGAPTAVGAAASTPWATAGPRRAEPASTALLARRSAFSSGIAEHFFLMLTTEVGTKASRHAVAV